MTSKPLQFFLGLCAAGFLTGCTTPTSPTAKTTKTSWWTRSERKKSGAQLWAENCGRCHNIRAPGSYDDAQWDVAIMHMRDRATLTGYEEREIVKFLKSAN